MQILTIPNKKLRVKSQKVIFIGYLIYKSKIKQMIKILEKHNGLGLAGVQVGILQRFFIMKHEGDYIAIYNPKIIHKSKNTSVSHESCLSIPNNSASKLRSNKIVVEYQDSKFKPVQREFKGLSAIVFQHEYDHLDGKLIIDKD